MAVVGFGVPGAGCGDGLPPKRMLTLEENRSVRQNHLCAGKVIKDTQYQLSLIHFITKPLVSLIIFKATQCLRVILA